ncbi:CD3337/EF1877 family mobilome membrane protein [Paenibacillus sp. 1P07SE]|uniref:CD3337/EF1877 family mobilome membrane protein n=1 Tax=Paenibacillus sp. 1P07SE TaxID=3132209 RepID=UPI0039A76013
MKLINKKVVLLLLMFSFLAGGVQASTLEDNLVPRETRSHEGAVELQYNKYDTSRYQLDLHIDRTRNPFNVSGKISDGVQATRLDLVNGGWSLMVVIFYFVISVVGEAFKLDIIDSIIGEISEAIKTIAGFDEGGFRSDGIWPSLIILIISIVGAWAAYVGIVKREQSRATSGILSMIIIFAFGLGFISQSDRILPLVNGWSKELQMNVLNSTSNIISPGSNYNSNEGIAAVQNQMFDVMIYTPYLFLQYGAPQVDESRVDRMLQLEPGSEDRSREAEKEVNEYDNKMMSVEGLNSRTWFVGLLLFANLILAGQMLLMAAAVVLYQILFIALVLFAPVPLLMALVPAWRGSAFNWAMKTLHALLMKVGFALLMTVIFTIGTLIYNAVSMVEYGFLFVLGMQILCYVGIWFKRKELFSFITNTTANIASSTRGSLDSFREYRSRTREAIGGIPGASAAARFAKYSMLRSMIQGNQGFTPQMAGAAASGGSGQASKNPKKEKVKTAKAEFYQRDTQRRRRASGDPTIIDADYRVVDEEKKLGSNVRSLPSRSVPNHEQSLALRQVAAANSPSGRKGRIRANQLASRLPGNQQATTAKTYRKDAEQPSVIHLPSSTPSVAETRKQIKQPRKELVQRGQAENQTVVRNESANIAEQPGIGSSFASRSSKPSNNSKSHSERVQRGQAEHKTVLRNEQTRNNQVEQQNVTRNKNNETNRSQQINQVDKKNVNELSERMQSKTERRKEKLERQENTAHVRHKTEKVERSQIEKAEHTKKEKEQTTHRVISEAEKRNIRNEWNRQQEINLINRENRIKQQKERWEQRQQHETHQVTDETPKRSWFSWGKGGRQ